jgi:hypothetical protein
MQKLAGKVWLLKLQKLAEKVVVFFTWNPEKLSLHFSDFSTSFYEFYKN